MAEFTRRKRIYGEAYTKENADNSLGCDVEKEVFDLVSNLVRVNKYNENNGGYTDETDHFEVYLANEYCLPFKVKLDLANRNGEPTDKYFDNTPYLSKVICDDLVACNYRGHYYYRAQGVELVKGGK